MLAPERADGAESLLQRGRHFAVNGETHGPLPFVRLVRHGTGEAHRADIRLFTARGHLHRRSHQRLGNVGYLADGDAGAGRCQSIDVDDEANAVIYLSLADGRLPTDRGGRRR